MQISHPALLLDVVHHGDGVFIVANRDCGAGVVVRGRRRARRRG